MDKGLDGGPASVYSLLHKQTGPARGSVAGAMATRRYLMTKQDDMADLVIAERLHMRVSASGPR